MTQVEVFEQLGIISPSGTLSSTVSAGFITVDF